MKKHIFLTLLLIPTILISQVPANYYNSANGLSGYALKTELKNIINTNFNSLSYSYLYTVYHTSDADNYYENDGTVLDMYSEKPTSLDSYSYTQITANRCTASSLYVAEAECYNREHIVPQIAFNYQFPMKSDAHFVFPTDGFVNLQRGSLPFGEVTNPIWTSTNGSKKGNNSTPGYSSYVFEPIDEFKGDIARAIFYFATMYEDSVAGWNHTMFNNTSDQVFEDWFLDILLDWHAQDPVSARDITRNNIIYNNQNNANPFINHPEYVNMIWNPIDTINPTAPTNLTASNITSNSVVLNWTASTDNYVVAGYNIFRDGVLIDSTSSTNFTDVGLVNNTSYSYYIVAKDNTPNFSVNSNTVSITTSTLAPVYLIADSFENACINSSFVTYDVASNKDWECLNIYGYNNSGCMRMNGYQEDVLSDDWLITANKVSFSNYNNTKFSVYLQYAYGWMSLDLVYSTNYTNGTDPSLATWTAVPNVTIASSSGNSSTSVQDIINADISAITADAHIAFHYLSNGSPTRWNVDNVIITGIQNVSDMISPSNPTNLIASNITTNSVDLNWNASTDNVGVTAYDIYRDGAIIATTSATTYTDNTLIASSSYTYYVVANDAAGNISGNSNSVSITTNPLPDVISPSNPTNLVASNVTNTSVVLNWTASTDNVGVIGYDIYRDGSLLTSTPNTNYTDNGLTASTSYAYYVVAKDAAGNVSGNSNTENITTSAIADLISPSTPTNLIANNITNTSVDLNWNASSDNIGVTAYDIFRDGSLLTSTPNINYTDNSLTANTSYTYYVVAKDAAGNISGNSNTENITTLMSSDVTAPSAPTNLLASNITSNSVDLNWTASTDNIGVAAYDLYRDGAFLNTSTNLNFIDNGLSANTSYAYHVVAKDAAGNISGNSNTENITTLNNDSTNVGINELYFKNLKVFPNPTKTGNLRIETEVVISEIKVYSVLGELIKKQKKLNSKTIEIESLQKGSYILIISSKGKSIQRKIIVL